MPPSARTKALVTVAAPFVALGLLEFGVRLAEAAPPERQAPIEVWSGDARDDDLFASKSLHQFHRGWLWEPRPGAIHGRDSLGDKTYRGPSYPLEPRPALRILALGESSTFGMSVPEAQSWPRQLEALLRAAGLDVQVLNYGVIGHTLAQGVERYEREARAWRPDIVLACYGGRNEIAPVGAGPDDLEKIAAFDSPSVRLRMELDGLASVRWLFGARKATSGPPAAAGRQRVSAQQYDELVARLSADAKEDGARLAFVVQPYAPRHEAEKPRIGAFRQSMLASLLTHDVVYSDVHGALRGRSDGLEASGSTSSWFLDDAHPNAAGARLFAESIEATLRDNGWIPARSP